MPAIALDDGSVAAGASAVGLDLFGRRPRLRLLDSGGCRFAWRARCKEGQNYGAEDGNRNCGYRDPPLTVTGWEGGSGHPRTLPCLTQAMHPRGVCT
jgi:hypothetical protein